MNGSFLKYLTKGEETQRTEDGFPLRNGRRALLKREEVEDLPVSFDAHCKVFDLSNPEHLAEYEAVLDKVANGLWVRLAPDKEMEAQDKKGWLVLCRWAEVKGEIPLELAQYAY